MSIVVRRRLLNQISKIHHETDLDLRVEQGDAPHALRVHPQGRDEPLYLRFHGRVGVTCSGQEFEGVAEIVVTRLRLIVLVRSGMNSPGLSAEAEEVALVSVDRADLAPPQRAGIRAGKINRVEFAGLTDSFAIRVAHLRNFEGFLEAMSPEYVPRLGPERAAELEEKTRQENAQARKVALVQGRHKQTRPPSGDDRQNPPPVSAGVRRISRLTDSRAGWIGIGAAVLIIGALSALSGRYLVGHYAAEQARCSAPLPQSAGCVFGAVATFAGGMLVRFGLFLAFCPAVVFLGAVFVVRKQRAKAASQRSASEFRLRPDPVSPQPEQPSGSPTADRRADACEAGEEADRAAQLKTAPREAPRAEELGGDGGAANQSTGTRPSRRRRTAQRLAGMLTVAGLLAAGALTHVAVRPGRLAAADGSLMLMQRMGPPPGLLGAYKELNADTAVIRDRSTGRVLATGMYADLLTNLAALPGFTSSLPRSVRHLLEVGQVHTYAAIFLAPLSEVESRDVVVDTRSLQLSGTVVRKDSALGLAAIAVTMTEAQVSGLDGPPELAAVPSAGTLRPRQLILLRNPALFSGSADFALTGGGLRGAGRSWCDAPVSGAGAGAPLGYVLPSGELVLIGLAVPSVVPGQCSILGAWTFSQLLSLVNTSAGPSRATAYLGVIVESTATARRELGYRGQRTGAYIASVEPGSPAVEAGLRPGDVITRIDAKTVRPFTALHAYIHALRPGSTHTVTYVRHGEIHAVRVMLGSIPSSAGSG